MRNVWTCFDFLFLPFLLLRIFYIEKPVWILLIKDSMMTKMHGRVELQRHDKFLFLLFFFNIPAWFCGVCLFIHLFCFCTGMLLCIQISKVLKRQNHARRHFTVCCMFSFPFLYPVLERLQCFSLFTYLIVM